MNTFKLYLAPPEQIEILHVNLRYRKCFRRPTSRSAISNLLTDSERQLNVHIVSWSQKFKFWPPSGRKINVNTKFVKKNSIDM